MGGDKISGERMLETDENEEINSAKPSDGNTFVMAELQNSSVPHFTTNNLAKIPAPGTNEHKKYTMLSARQGETPSERLNVNQLGGQGASSPLTDIMV